ncbi:MAG TPA: hypothetical protein PK055_04270 [Gammaproteobacteria bacterium]|nr:hypothetical protein [Xanthomonadales bacterium]MCB1594310.1 hypothetical protein [Xanthomonadales bacterium]HOP23137.1 hypothetical protein [Gammaproteobacteria bacterium]HPI95096.1 hypothetical protein [Gammaproteobacteria bacterium]HPQ86854.1 hypothetical protein [Gammaproteobacteria bacterium]
MKKDKNIVWLFLTFLSFNFCNAAHGPLNHLVPADSFGRLYSDVKYITTSKLNIDADNEGYLLQFIKYPSFDLVSSTVVIENYKKNEYRVAYTTKKKPDRKYSQRNIKTIYRAIHKQSVEKLSKIYEEILLKTRYSEIESNKRSLGLDGTVFEFFISSMKFGNLFGETWSPSKGTNTYFLVQASEALNQYVKEEISEENLNTVFDNTIKRLQIALKPNYLDEEIEEFRSLEPFLNCNIEELAPYTLSASIAIQEIANDKDISEENTDPTLMVWRHEACELLELNAELYTETEYAIEKECSKLIKLKGENENEYIEDVRKHLSWYKNPSHVVLAWVIKDNKQPMHTIIATDGIEGIRVKFPGYGRDGTTNIECINSPEKIFYF